MAWRDNAARDGLLDVRRQIQKAEADTSALSDALDFYADQDNYTAPRKGGQPAILADKGRRAGHALEKIGSENGEGETEENGDD